MEIKQVLLTPNRYSRPGKKMEKVKKIVIHWVGNANTSAMANRNYFESLKVKKVFASAHYIIGLEGEILQCIPESEIAYHATTANGYSIGIENCHPDWKGEFNSKTYRSLIELCAGICKCYHLDPEKDILRHYDISKKLCPKYYVENPDAWTKLKKDVKNKIEKKEGLQLLEALEILRENNILLDDKVWGDVKAMNMKYAKLMVEKVGKGLGTNGYRQTIETLVSMGCINSSEIWVNERFIPEYCRALLIKIANCLRDNKKY